MANERLSRRERIHDRTVSEIRRIALGQMKANGAGSISMNAIAREMGMTGPALFRYVPNREALLTDLVVEAYEELAALLDADITGDDPRLTERILRDQSATLRAWAHENPHRYLFVFGTPVPGFQPPAERIAPAAMLALTSAIRPLIPIAPATWEPSTDAYDRELEAWAASNEIPPMPGRMIKQAFQSWTRLHGVLSLELVGQFPERLPDAGGLYQAEVDGLIDLVRDYLPDSPDDA